MIERMRSTTSAPDLESTDILAGESGRLTDLNYTTKLYCCGGCMALSFLCSILGAPFLFVHKFAEFGIMMSVSACLSIISTFFIGGGPLAQLKRMFEPTRLIASILYISAVCLTLVSGIYLRNPILAIGCIVAQYLTLAWYTLSYIPFARETLRSLLGTCC